MVSSKAQNLYHALPSSVEVLGVDVGILLRGLCYLVVRSCFVYAEKTVSNAIIVA